MIRQPFAICRLPNPITRLARFSQQLSSSIESAPIVLKTAFRKFSLSLFGCNQGSPTLAMKPHTFTSDNRDFREIGNVWFSGKLSQKLVARNTKDKRRDPSSFTIIDRSIPSSGRYGDFTSPLVGYRVLRGMSIHSLICNSAKSYGRSSFSALCLPLV